MPNAFPRPAASGGPLPRFIKEFERAIVGTVRFRMTPVGGQPLYVVAQTGDQAGAVRLVLGTLPPGSSAVGLNVRQLSD